MGSPIVSRRFRREPFAADHARARDLAAQRVDGPVAPDDAGWLNDHLAWCGPCRAVAAEYDEQRLALRALRHDQPVPPRDLWARTAAAIEAEPARRRPAGAGRRTGFAGYAPLVAALVVAVALGGTLLDNALPQLGSTTKGDDPEATPINLVAGDVQVLSHGDDGSLEISSRHLNQLCPVTAKSCGLANVPDVTRVADIGTSGQVDAIVSPDRGQLVVVESGSGSSSIFVVPLKKHPVANPTPRSSAAAASSPASSDEPVNTASAGPDTTATPDVTEAPASGEPGQSPDTSAEPAASDNPPSDAAGSPPASSEPTEAPSPTEKPTKAPDPTDEPTPEPTPKGTEPAPSVEVTPGPDGAIEIARDVVIVGSGAAYSPDGTRFAFSARPAKGSAGPDVFVWRVGDRLAKAVTTDHGSLLAGWIGERLLISRVVDGKPRTSILDLDDGSQRQAGDGTMWRPTVGPGRKMATWWEGTVKRADDGITWVPDRGRLVLGTWPDGGDSQVLADGAITDWDVSWDESGTKLAVWVSRDAPGKAGKLSLYTVDPETGRPDLANPPLDGAPAYAGFAIQPGRLAWSSPDDGGDTSVVVLGWSGNTFGKVNLPTDNGATVLR